MKHKVSELEGDWLDYCVARLEGHEVDPPLAEGQPWPDRETLGRKFEPNYIAYSTQWQFGGPLIERERINLDPDYTTGGDWAASLPERGWSVGSTPLIAAMRAYVASKFGEEMELP